MLADLLNIKRLHEDDAVAALAEARASLDQKTTAHQLKQREQADYETWRIAEEERLYQRIQGKNITLSKLEVMREKIASLRSKDLQLQEEVVQAAQDVECARKALAEAAQRRIEAHKDVVKYEEYQQILLDAEQHERERQEEVESEDLLSGKFSTRAL